MANRNNSSLVASNWTGKVLNEARAQRQKQNFREQDQDILYVFSFDSASGYLKDENENFIRG